MVSVFVVIVWCLSVRIRNIDTETWPPGTHPIAFRHLSPNNIAVFKKAPYARKETQYAMSKKVLITTLSHGIIIDVRQFRSRADWIAKDDYCDEGAMVTKSHRVIQWVAHYSDSISVSGKPLGYIEFSEKNEDGMDSSIPYQITWP